MRAMERLKFCRILGRAGVERSEAEVDGDRDALARAAIRADAVRKPAREDDEHAGLRRQPLRLAEGRAVGPGKRQIRRVHDRRHAARVLDLELAAERSVGADAAVVDVIGRGPERAGMRVELVAVALPVDVGPGVDAPGDLVPLAGAVDGDLVGDGPAKASTFCIGAPPHWCRSQLDCQPPWLERCTDSLAPRGRG